MRIKLFIVVNKHFCQKFILRAMATKRKCIFSGDLKQHTETTKHRSLVQSGKTSCKIDSFVIPKNYKLDARVVATEAT